MLALGEKDMRAALGMDEAITAAREALGLIAKDSCDIPLRGRVVTPEPAAGTTLFMYGAVPSANALGIKLYAEFAGNADRGLPLASATVVLLDAQTGRPEALLNGTYLTQLRTGAASGAATAALARKDAHTFALIGTGAQAWSQLEAVCAVRDIREVRLFSLDVAAAQRLAATEAERLGGGAPRFTIAGSAEEAVSGADIITCVTTSKKPLFPAGALTPGAHINAVGSYLPEMGEIGPDVLCRADRVYIDTPAALEESGDLLIPLRQGLWSVDALSGLVGGVFLGGVPGRQADDEITLFEAVGSAADDLVVGQRMVERARELGLGTRISLD